MVSRVWITADPGDRRLDRLVRTRVRIGGRQWSSFYLCGLTGLGLAFLLAQGLVRHEHMSPLVMTGLSVVAVATFLGLAMLTKVLTGEETLVYYHHEIAIILTSALFLQVGDQPVLSYLDPTILGVGLFLACGRVGCFLVGCCHGRPARYGVRYRQEHADAGFTAYYVGVRLFPIQLVESVWVFTVVAVGVLMIWTGHPPGTTFAWYVVAYDAGRFVIEFARGDPDRSEHAGFTTPQWLSVILTWLVVVAGWLELLPGQSWHLGVAAALTLAGLLIFIRRNGAGDSTWQVRTPTHVRELARFLDATAPADQPQVHVTSCGIMISSGRRSSALETTDHYTLSVSTGSRESALRASVEIVRNLRARFGESETIEGGNGVCHVLVHRTRHQEQTAGSSAQTFLPVAT